MAIQVGEKLPGGTLQVAGAGGIEGMTTDQLFAGRKVVLFAVPGAFTPTCSAKHLPGFVQHAAAIRAKGIDAIVCLAVNDAFVMGAWGRDQQVGSEVVMAADGNGEWTRALGLELDASRFGMGTRSQRFAMVVDDGVVRSLAVDVGGKLEVSSAEAILRSL
ncbi:MAG: peroxiredoxin [Deltaproteobacteria bacterium]|nr:peroxiredoxin [Deltaproteobacteria bacterium]